MLTLKQIYDDKAKVIAGLQKKHFVDGFCRAGEMFFLQARNHASFIIINLF